MWQISLLFVHPKLIQNSFCKLLQHHQITNRMLWKCTKNESRQKFSLSVYIKFFVFWKIKKRVYYLPINIKVLMHCGGSCGIFNIWGHISKAFTCYNHISIAAFLSQTMLVYQKFGNHVFIRIANWMEVVKYINYYLI